MGQLAPAGREPLMGRNVMPVTMLVNELSIKFESNIGRARDLGGCDSTDGWRGSPDADQRAHRSVGRVTGPPMTLAKVRFMSKVWAMLGEYNQRKHHGY